ncbi:MAG: type 4a pilus biogenesis protein PilO [Candidatus Hydrogenedentota bacterium]
MTIGKKEQMYIVILVGALIYALYTYGWQPLYKKHTENLSQIAELSKELEQARRNARKLPEILAQSQRVKKQLEETKKILVEKIEVEGLYKLFDPIFEKVGIDKKNELLGINRAGGMTGDFYIEDRWVISLQVPFEKLSLILLEFYQYERLLDVTSLPINIVGKTKTGQPVINVQLPISTYTYKGGETLSK